MYRPRAHQFVPAIEYRFTSRRYRREVSENQILLTAFPLPDKMPEELGILTNQISNDNTKEDKELLEKKQAMEESEKSINPENLISEKLEVISSKNENGVQEMDAYKNSADFNANNKIQPALTALNPFETPETIDLYASEENIKRE